MPALSQKLVNRLVIAAVIIGFLTVGVAGLLGARALQQNLNYTAWVTHTYQVQQALSDYRILNERVETARRGFLLSRDPQFLVVYERAKRELYPALDQIEELTGDNAVQQSNIKGLRLLLGNQLEALDNSVEAAKAGRAQDRFGVDEGVASTRAIRAITDRMSREERAKLLERDADRRASVADLTRILSVAGVLLVVTGLGSLWVILAFTRDLTASRNQLARLNAGLEDEVQARTADLQRANDEIQRFAYIVSHDLRSPLVNVMGFTSELEASVKPLASMVAKAEAEAPGLVTTDARLAVESDLPEAIGFIRNSTQKMDRLINAILQLSRQGRRVLVPEKVDVQKLMEGIAGSLKHRSDEVGATIEVTPGLPTLITDRLAFEQIFSNLVENALKYLKPGRPGQIQVRGQRLPGGRVQFEVIDNGRGVDAKDHERIFELFRRSGAQDQPGEGIGLAHVRALAYRLGGTVTVESALDQGATFRVSLPAKLSLEGAAE
ncbi:sensor histidine kinase [Phenylobacterium deserti]|uniref:histidine kinase n=1 Tax=Phenylobacterium deserti TaxID=1914756 RepID=A0A328AQT1_9CAUL|nr:sensor histidine kinase [Phenylobacterium deserti]RAK56939.1 histidine kinase [Phenylobacterium deserti]